jgi:hypothetical protein
MRKLNLEIIPRGSLNHITVEATLKDSIVMAQQHDEGVKIIKQMLAQGEEKYKCFQVDHKGILWFNGRIVLPKDHRLGIKNAMMHSTISEIILLLLQFWLNLMCQNPLTSIVMH